VSQRAQQLLEQPLLDHSALDLATAGRLGYVLRQSFRYEYDGPARDLHQRLVVIPQARHGNARRLLHRLTVSAPDAVTTVARRPGGAVVADVTVPDVPRVLEFTVAAVVARRGPYVDHALPVSALHDPRLLRPTRLTAGDDALRELASEVRHDDPLDTAAACCSRVHEEMPYEFGRTSVSTTAAEAFAIGHGVCQDHAHVMLAVCRALGIPARYVSGHLLGEGGTHAWVEVVVADGDRARAVAFDPCNGCRGDARYLTVATGRDYLDVAPTSGSYAGPGRGRLTATKHVGIAEAA
jgi:transglutaminase-like putative cysteine protease